MELDVRIGDSIISVVEKGYFLITTNFRNFTIMELK